MHDQAADLRQLVRQTLGMTPCGSRRPKLLVTAGAKGGVGTTTLALNLAVALVRYGRTILLDADPDAPDAATLCGLSGRYDLAHVLTLRRRMPEVLQPGPGGIAVIAGAWPAADLGHCCPTAQQRLIDQLGSLGELAEFVVIDAGDTPGPVARRFWQAADTVLLVTTAELPSLVDAYGAIKALAAGGARVSIRLVVNMAPRAVAEQVYQRLQRACHRLLGVRLCGMHCVGRGTNGAGGTGCPSLFVLARPRSAIARQVQDLADTLARSAIESFSIV